MHLKPARGQNDSRAVVSDFDRTSSQCQPFRISKSITLWRPRRCATIGMADGLQRRHFLRRTVPRLIWTKSNFQSQGAAIALDRINAGRPRCAGSVPLPFFEAKDDSLSLDLV
jgi:hypothetical protein